MIWMRLSEIISFSIPVPTIGDSQVTSGTAWRIMFDPMRARFASSCSRKGIRLAAIDAIWFGATSMSVTSWAVTTGKSAPSRALMRSGCRKWPSSSIGTFDWATTCPSSSSAE